MPTKSPLAFCTEHLDTCPECGVGKFCELGRKLMDQAAEVAGALVAPIPEIPRSKWKA